jgi:hypothetical protein
VELDDLEDADLRPIGLTIRLSRADRKFELSLSVPMATLLVIGAYLITQINW